MNREPTTPEDVVRLYHERTKHHLQRYAEGPGYLDWATQPDPFRRYRGAPLVSLPLPAAGHLLPYWALYVRDATPPAPLAVDSLSRFLRYSLSLTAWKELRGSRWALRANPSSGNLHPTEGYLVLPALAGLGRSPGVYHYAPREHGLEQRAELELPVWAALTADLPPGSFLVGLSSIHWREAWKYGERAYRYCQHDAGHALAALRLAAAALGWEARLIDGLRDDLIARLLGLDRDGDYPEGAEREAPDLLIAVTPGPTAGGPASDEDAVERAAATAAWQGKANRLSPEHPFDWRIIDLVASAAATRAGGGAAYRPSDFGASEQDFAGFPDEKALFGMPVRSGRLTAEQAILGRRSAVALDGTTSIPAATLFQMLGRVVPARANATPPWDALPWRPRLHLAIFVHRVDGLAPGLYALARDPAKLGFLRGAMRPEFRWEEPPGCPPGLALRLLAEGDLRGLAGRISCHQEIAADGAWSLGMLAELDGALGEHGAPVYRRLFWEAGMVGQVLYLEAEEAGIRGTGIGCYFDDAMHQVLGLADERLQSLYHFTAGGPVEDTRLTTLPAYG